MDIAEKSEIMGKMLRLSEFLSAKDPETVKIEENEDFLSLRALDLSHSGRRCLAILWREGKQNQRNLAKSLEISPQAVSEIVKKLLEKGCILKEQGLQKNENFISLTETGAVYGQLLDKIIQIHGAEFLSPLSEEELWQLSLLLGKLLAYHTEK